MTGEAAGEYTAGEELPALALDEIGKAVAIRPYGGFPKKPFEVIADDTRGEWLYYAPFTCDRTYGVADPRPASLRPASATAPSARSPP